MFHKGHFADANKRGVSPFLAILTNQREAQQYFPRYVNICCNCRTFFFNSVVVHWKCYFI